MRDALLDLLLGSSCLGCERPGRLLCAACAGELPTTSVPARPTPCPRGLATARAGGEYDGLLRSLVLAHKERRAFSLAAPLGVVLARACANLLGPTTPGGGAVLLVPVPSRRSVVALRGHDPTLRMVRAAADRLRSIGVPARTLSLLRATGRVQDQSGLGALERQLNLSGSMATRPGVVRQLARAGEPVRVLVCDDVLTTGATAREAQRAVEAVGIPVAGIACVCATRKRYVAHPGTSSRR